MNNRRLRRVLRDLPMPEPFDARTLCARVAEQRGRPMRLVPMSGLTGVCGLWVATETTDLLFYESDTTAPHQEHILLHELAHVLCDHYPSDLDTRGLLPSLDPAMVRRVLGRAGYSTKEEREAELLASMIRQSATGGTLGDRLRTSLDGHG